MMHQYEKLDPRGPNGLSPDARGANSLSQDLAFRRVIRLAAGRRRGTLDDDVSAATGRRRSRKPDRRAIELWRDPASIAALFTARLTCGKMVRFTTPIRH